jgi:hypothetical protein
MITPEHSKRRRTRRATSRHKAPGPPCDVATKSERRRADGIANVAPGMLNGKRGLPKPMRPLENQTDNFVKLWNQS